MYMRAKKDPKNKGERRELQGRKTRGRKEVWEGRLHLLWLDYM
jgi:hypothetical protein